MGTPFGIIAGGLIVLWMFVWIYRGPQTGAWQPLLVVVAFYTLWCLVLWRRVLTIDDDGILCVYLIGKPRRVVWGEVRRSVITLWKGGRPFQILVFGDSPDKPLLDIPLKLYDKPDVEFLMSLDKLRIERI